MIIYIKVWEAFDDDGYLYDLYASEQSAEDDTCDVLDGGHCTTTLENAIGMATGQAIDWAKAHNETLHGLQIAIE